MRGSVVGRRSGRLCCRSGRRGRVVRFLVRLTKVDSLIAVQSNVRVNHQNCSTANRTFCSSPKTLYVPSVGASGGIKYRSSGDTPSARRSFGVHFLPVELFELADSFLIFSNFSMLSVVKCFQNGGGGGKAAVRAR